MDNKAFTYQNFNATLAGAIHSIAITGNVSA